jgi:hypothetical protein
MELKKDKAQLIKKEINKMLRKNAKMQKKEME